jgi:hypothetical protein
MHSIQTAIAVALVAAISSAAAAQSSPDPKKKPGVWQDIITQAPFEGPYEADITTAKRVIERCARFERSIRARPDGSIRRYSREYNTGYCLGWINSAKAFLQFHNAEGNHTLGVCMPEEITSRQVIDIFLTYAYKNTESLNYNPSLILYWSLLDRYPCPAAAAQPAGAGEKK